MESIATEKKYIANVRWLLFEKIVLKQVLANRATLGLLLSIIKDGVLELFSLMRESLE